MSSSHFCPACQAPFESFGDAEPVSCGACGGTFVPTLVAARFDSIRYNVITGEPSRSFSYECECPACSSTMSRRLLERVGAVDACGGCGSLWMGPGRYGRLEQVLAGVEARPAVVVPAGMPPSMWRMVGILSALSAAAAWVLTARVL